MIIGFHFITYDPIREFSHTCNPTIGVEDTFPDGNCGYRSLSLSLTATEDNHIQIRRDMINFFEMELQLSTDGVEGHDWWQIEFGTMDEAAEFVTNQHLPARDAIEVHKYAASTSFLGF